MNVIIPVFVEGTGAFSIGDGKFEFSHSFGTGQSVTGGMASVTNGKATGGVLQIERPDQFHGSTTLSYTDSGVPYSRLPEIDLIGLANADSHTHQNDILSIYAGKSVIDKPRLTETTSYGFSVEKTAGGVSIIAIGDPTDPPVGLPMHGAAERFLIIAGDRIDFPNRWSLEHLPMWCAIL